MHREAACQRTLATATFHGGNRDDRAHHSTLSRPSRGEVIRRIKTLSDSRRIVPRCRYLVTVARSVSRPGTTAAACGAHRLRTGECRKTQRTGAYRGFQIVVGIFWDKYIFVGLGEMVHRIRHGFHPSCDRHD